MLMSRLLGERYKEKPADATMVSHIFLLRGGYMRQVANGIYSLLPPAKRVVSKIENIIRQEMDAIDGQEVLMPVVLPAELWKESGRWESVGSELMRIKDRAGMDMLLGMTHEEAVVHLARSEAMSYTKYPFMLYQIQTKFRDEPRSRGGLIRVREFTMKDAYSFHTSQEDLEQYYMRCHAAYERIYQRAGLKNVISVFSDTGMMGGSAAHEFMLINDFGEDSLVICKECGYSANMEIAKCVYKNRGAAESEIEEVYTPDMKDIESIAKKFDTDASNTIKATVFATDNSDKPLVVFIRGDLEVNEAKLKRVVGSNVYPYTDYEHTDLTFGFIGPYNLQADCDVLYDESLRDENDLVCGANKENYHVSGVCMKRDVNPAEYVDVAKVLDGAICPKCGKPISLERGIEIGNIFQLGTKYTKSMHMEYVDANGKLQTPIMGCYGIGVGRLLASVIEDNHDDHGPIWPMSVAPWQIHICSLNNQKEEVRAAAEELYSALSGKYDVIMDDRKAAPGIQFADADLLGVPVRVIVSQRGLANGEIEIATRDKSVKMNVKKEDALAQIEALTERLCRESK